LDIDALRAWIGRTETASELVTAGPIQRLAATLDRDDPAPQQGDEIPPLWHWLYFLPATPQSGLGPDGHAKLGGFLPPVPLSSRMWAGGRVEFHQPVRVGEEATRRSRILNVQFKEGRSGPLVFVTVEHEIMGRAGAAVREEQDLVYRQPGGTRAASPPAPGAAHWRRTIEPNETLLFRYSALTFNGHRIHYDRRWAEAEGYPGLVVHGPLIATLLADLLRRKLPSARVTRFEFRGVSPLFDTSAFEVCGRTDREAVRLWAQSAAGALAMEARAVVA
jgi:3-methylfumaryl-CoA hydratase